MLVKCESKSQRVKGLSFHPRLSWVLVSLHTGVIQLWDYRLGCLIEKFEEHSGPVRGINFHQTQPLFVSGGDDNKVKVWDYHQRKSVFSLLGHLDYIRTVQFHHEYPWICSAADDQTVLTGHHHYVMCATFSPTEDLLASASLDQTIRIWDLSGLREKTVSSSMGHGGVVNNPAPTELFGATDAVSKFILEGHERGVNWVAFHHTNRMLVTAADDRLIKLWRFDSHKWWEVDTMRGHFNNVSCVAFHPLKDVVVSNAEDRTIRIWDLSRRTLLHTYRRDNDRFWALAVQPHSNLLAVGHDTGMVVFKLERERPAVSTTVESGNVCSLHIKEGILYLQPDALRFAIQCSLSQSAATVDADSQNSPNETEFPSGLVRRQTDSLSGAPHSIMRNLCNTTETSLAILYKAAASGSPGDAKWSYDIHTLPVPIGELVKRTGAEVSSLTVRTESGTCNAFAFCARNKFVTLDAAGQLHLHAVSGSMGEVRKRLDIPGEIADGLFSAGNNKILVRSEDTLFLYDVVAKKKIGEMNSAMAGTTGANGKIRSAIWSTNGSFVALLSKHYVILAKANLEFLTSAHECIRVKSGVWDDHGAFIYNTVSHIKYILPSQDAGIFQSISESGLYLQAFRKNQAIFITKKSTLRRVSINTSEELLKIALNKGKMDVVASILRTNPMHGNVWVGYLKRRGFPEVAYHCVKDLATKAVLATQFADLEAATEAVIQLNQPTGWRQLGEVAVNLGNVTVADKAFQRARRYSSLIHLYTITGNFEKLDKLGSVLNELGDKAHAFHICKISLIQFTFHQALVTGNVEDRVKILRGQQQPTLAYATAKNHGLVDLAEEIGSSLAPDVRARIDDHISRCGSKRLLRPPLPVHRESQGFDWPTRDKTIAKRGSTSAGISGAFDELMKSSATKPADLLIASREMEFDGEYFARIADLCLAESKLVSEYADAASEAENGMRIDPVAWGEDDEDDWFGGEDQPSSKPGTEGDEALQRQKAAASPTTQTAPGDPSLGQPLLFNGQSVEDRALGSLASPSIADLVAAGEFKLAFVQLDKKIGLCNAMPLIPIFEACFQSSQSSIPLLPLLSSLRLPLLESGGASSKSVSLHKLVAPAFILSVIHEGLVRFSSKRLVECRETFQRGLHFLTLAHSNSAADAAQYLESLKTCRNYILAVDLENAKTTDAGSRELELSIMATSCELQLSHKFLLLKEASRLAVKTQNFVTGAALARKMLAGEYESKLRNVAQDLERMKGVLVTCEKKGTNSFDLSLDASIPSNKLRFCGADLEYIKPSEDTVECGFCQAEFRVKHKGKACRVCSIAELGRQVLGLNFTHTHS